MPRREPAASFPGKMAAFRRIRLTCEVSPEQQVHKKLRGSVAFTHFPETATPFANGRRTPGASRCGPRLEHDRTGSVNQLSKLPKQPARFRITQARCAEKLFQPQRIPYFFGQLDANAAHIFAHCDINVIFRRWILTHRLFVFTPERVLFVKIV